MRILWLPLLLQMCRIHFGQEPSPGTGTACVIQKDCHCASRIFEEIVISRSVHIRSCKTMRNRGIINTGICPSIVSGSPTHRTASNRCFREFHVQGANLTAEEDNGSGKQFHDV